MITLFKTYKEFLIPLLSILGITLFYLGMYYSMKSDLNSKREELIVTQKQLAEMQYELMVANTLIAKQNVAIEGLEAVQRKKDFDYLEALKTRIETKKASAKQIEVLQNALSTKVDLGCTDALNKFRGGK